MVTLLFYGFIFLTVFILCGIGTEKTDKKRIYTNRRNSLNLSNINRLYSCSLFIRKSY